MNGIRALIPGLILVTCWVCSSTAAGAPDRCFLCHETLGDGPSMMFKKDVHYLKGVSCAGCHGGDASAEDADRAMSPAAGFIGVPKDDDISRRCGQCHARSDLMAGYQSALPTNQLDLLQSSVPGKPATSGRGRIAQCTTCHTAHGILRVSDPASPVSPLKVVSTCARCHSNAAYMRTYNPSLPVDQLEKYRTSVHGGRNAKGDRKVAECSSCHGSHGILPTKDLNSSVAPANVPATCGRCHADAAYMREYGIPTDQLEEFTASIHGVALLQRRDPGAPACNSCHGNHGATPPGVESISKVCGTCHALNAELFAGSPHKKAYDDMNLPECETCHGNHAIVTATNELLGTGPKAACSRCHTDRDLPEGYRVAGVMRGMVDSLERAQQHASALVEEAEQKGMEIGEAKFKLRDAHQARLEARTAVHAFNEERFLEIAGKGLATAARVTMEAQQAVDEYSFRRVGLGAATLVITVTALSLFLFIRRLERRDRSVPPLQGHRT